MSVKIFSCFILFRFVSLFLSLELSFIRKYIVYIDGQYFVYDLDTNMHSRGARKRQKMIEVIFLVEKNMENPFFLVLSTIELVQEHGKE